MSTPATLRWRDARWESVDSCELGKVAVLAADSWLVDAGRVLALDLHRSRFLTTLGRTPVGAEFATQLRAEAFWDAAIARLPREGAWFPRVEARTIGMRGELLLRVRPAPELTRAIVLATHAGPDPRTAPTIKGPDLEAMVRLRTLAQARGADEAVLLEGGAVVEGTTTSLMWWRADALCVPGPEFARIDSVTSRSVLALATALGVEVRYEAVTPGQLDGLEVWAVNALHGIRIVTDWVDGPSVAQIPGRLGLWRARLEAIRRPLPETIAA